MEQKENPESGLRSMFGDVEIGGMIGILFAPKLGAAKAAVTEAIPEEPGSFYLQGADE